MSRTQFVRAVLIVGFSFTSLSGLAEEATTDTTTEDTQALKDMQADAALAKAKLELATSELDLLKLKVGSIDTTNLPKGTATVTDMNLEGQLRAYSAAQKITNAIAIVVAAKVPEKTVVLATEAQLQAINQYRSFLTQMEQMKASTNAVINAPAPPLVEPKECAAAGGKKTAAMVGLGGAMVAINGLLSVASLFKTDITLKGEPITLNDFGVTALLLQSLMDNGVTVIYPGAYYLLPQASSKGEALTKYNEVFALKQKLRDAATDYGSKFDKISDAQSKPSAECKAALASLKQGVDKYVAGLAASEKSIDEITAILTKQDAQSGLTILSSYLVSERVEAATHWNKVDDKKQNVKDANGKDVVISAPVLQVKAITAGGSTQTRKNWFSTSISYGGGSIIAYQLFNQDGTLIGADTIPWYAGFKNAKDFSAGRVSLDESPKKSKP